MTISIKEIPLRSTISGLTHSISVMEYKHPQAKATIYFQAALHAAETNGIALINEMRKFLEKYPFPYNVILVPFANPFAMDIKVGEYTYGRFDTKTGENWNRGFVNLLDAMPKQPAIDLPSFVKTHKSQGFESLCDAFNILLDERLKQYTQENVSPSQKLAAVLHQLALKADFSFDLHCDSISVPYIYAPSYLKNKRIRHFNHEAFIFTPNESSGCFNQAIFYPWWQLTEQWNTSTGEKRQPPKYAFTYEMGCKEVYDVTSAKHLLRGIINYIQDDESVDDKPVKMVCDESDFFRVQAPIGGLVEYDDKILGKIQKANAPLTVLHTRQSILGQADPVKLTLPTESILLTRTSSCSVHESDEVLKAMINIVQV